ncbi:hypothetical protein KEM54_007002 [Ascosphaera aggregata]|nr:hypothetical protein KEM54_007002 [Ascosphaera aggregata]
MSATSPAFSPSSPSPSPSPSLASNIAGFLRLPMIASGGLAVAATGMLYFKQNEIIYPRNVPAGSRTDILTPDHFRIPSDAFERVQLNTPDGVTLDSFLIKPLRKLNNSPRITIVMFHGNAGNIGHRVPIAEAFAYNVGCNVFMVEYRGYGASTGAPDEKGIKIDAQTALNHLLSRHDTKDTKIVVFGQSLGGAVSSWLSVNNQDKIAAVILENTFLSLRKMVPR